VERARDTTVVERARIVTDTGAGIVQRARVGVRRSIVEVTCAVECIDWWHEELVNHLWCYQKSTGQSGALYYCCKKVFAADLLIARGFIFGVRSRKFFVGHSKEAAFSK
jgi:hypothetical protein